MTAFAPSKDQPFPLLTKMKTSCSDAFFQNADITVPYSQRLWAAKAGQLRALQSEEDPARATHQLEAMGREFLADMAIALTKSARGHAPSARLSARRLPGADRGPAEGLDQPSSVFAWEVPDDLLSRFPQHVRVFFRPQDLTPQPTPGS